MDLNYDFNQPASSRVVSECESEKIRQAFGMTSHDGSSNKRSCFSSEVCFVL